MVYSRDLQAMLWGIFMKKQHLLSLLLCTTVLSGCASMYQGSEQNITVSTINDKNINKTRCNVKNEEGSWTVAPNSAASIHRDGNVMEIQCDNDIQTGKNQVEPDFNGGYLGLNFLLDLCTISCIVDGANNALYQYPPFINVQMNDKNGAMVKEPVSYNTNKPVINQTVEKVPVPSYQPIAQPQVVQQPVQPVVQETAPTYQTYQQPQVEHSGKDLRYCLALVDNAAIARCVKGK